MMDLSSPVERANYLFNTITIDANWLNILINLFVGYLIIKYLITD